jgi:uncharacterized protein (DUF433 family)
VTTDPEILSGTPVFASSRVPIEVVLASLARGEPFTRLQESWPFLTAEHIQAARDYARDREWVRMPPVGKEVW